METRTSAKTRGRERKREEKGRFKKLKLDTRCNEKGKMLLLLQTNGVRHSQAHTAGANSNFSESVCCVCALK